MKTIIKIVGIGLIGIVGVLFVIGLIPDSKVIPPGFAGNFIEVEGAQLRVQQVGNGPDILFIHGLPAMLETFDPLVKLLSSSCRLTLYDRPANGFSGAQGDKYTIEYNAHIALELIKKLNLKKVVIVGHSFGCSVAASMALQDASVIKSLVLLGCPCMYYGDGKKSMLGALIALPVFGRGVAFVIGKTVGKSMMEKTLRQAIYPSDPALIETLMANAQKYWTTPKVLVGFSKEKRSSPASRKEMSARYKNVKTKVILIHGQQDQLAPVQHSIDASKTFPNSLIIIWKNDGHFLHYSRPEDVARIILAETR
jgi:pimeloyl-ACP methyl ester carboxylesterase